MRWALFSDSHTSFEMIAAPRARQAVTTLPRVIVCDVNEILLDMGAPEPHFKQTFGDNRVLQEWFANVLLYSEVATLAGPILRLRQYRRGLARDGSGRSRNHPVVDRPEPNPPRHADPSGASRRAGRVYR